MICSGHGAFIVLLALSCLIVPITCASKLPSQVLDFIHGDTITNAGCSTNLSGKRWAVLVAGSKGYYNYRHQADVCHAYQILKKGGLKDENIIVFMYDDIAFNDNNPRPGVIINKPNGGDVYAGVPKVFYLEACESGSIFEGLLPNNLNIYATTASNASEDSYAAYCPEDSKAVEEYDTCLGDLYSISWLEDSDKHDLRQDTLQKQYEVIRRRTIAGVSDRSSHVMQYGNKKQSNECLYYYMGTNPANDNYAFVENPSSPSTLRVVNQRDANLLHFWHKYHKAPAGSHEKLKAQKELNDEISLRKHVDYSINHIGELLFGNGNSSKVLETVRPSGQPIVDDWNCFKMLVSTYEKYCGSLSKYGTQHMRAIANMCNAGVTMKQMVAASTQTCFKIPPTN